MNEKPILFSGEMIKAILDNRKTQTRRTINPQPGDDYTNNSKISYDADGDCLWWRLPGPMVMAGAKNKYGKTGDRLWVKETFQPVQLAGEVTQWRYRATDPKGLANWKPSIFMPRRASRITLEITAVRVERLQDIIEDDAEAEGCSHDFLHSHTCSNDNCALCGGVDDCEGVAVSAKENYRALWERINGQGSWEQNPWVWVITFNRIKL